MKTADELMKEYYDNLEKEIIELREILKNGGQNARKYASSGRPSLGITKKVSVTLPEDDWTKISELIENKHVGSFSEYFRNVHQSNGTGWKLDNSDPDTWGPPLAVVKRGPRGERV